MDGHVRVLGTHDAQRLTAATTFPTYTAVVEHLHDLLMAMHMHLCVGVAEMMDAHAMRTHVVELRHDVDLRRHDYHVQRCVLLRWSSSPSPHHHEEMMQRTWVDDELLRGLSCLASLAGEVLLRVEVRPTTNTRDDGMDVGCMLASPREWSTLFVRRWAKGEEVLNAHDAPTMWPQLHHMCAMLMRVDVRVEDLFWCLPIRRVAYNNNNSTTNIMRCDRRASSIHACCVEQQHLSACLYRQALVELVAPQYLSTSSSSSSLPSCGTTILVFMNPSVEAQHHVLDVATSSVLRPCHDGCAEGIILSQGRSSTCATAETLMHQWMPTYTATHHRQGGSVIEVVVSNVLAVLFHVHASTRARRRKTSAASTHHIPCCIVSAVPHVVLQRRWKVSELQSCAAFVVDEEHVAHRIVQQQHHPSGVAPLAIFAASSLLSSSSASTRWQRDGRAEASFDGMYARAVDALMRRLHRSVLPQPNTTNVVDGGISNNMMMMEDDVASCAVMEEPHTTRKRSRTVDDSHTTTPTPTTTASTELRLRHVLAVLASTSTAQGWRQRRRGAALRGGAMPRRTPIISTATAALPVAANNTTTSSLDGDHWMRYVEVARTAMQLDPAYAESPLTMLRQTFATPKPWRPPNNNNNNNNISEVRPRCPVGPHTGADEVYVQWDQKFVVVRQTHTTPTTTASEEEDAFQRSLKTYAQMHSAAEAAPAHSSPHMMATASTTTSSSSSSSSSSCVVQRWWFVDPHAAHERLRLEFLLAFVEAFVIHPELPRPPSHMLRANDLHQRVERARRLTSTDVNGCVGEGAACVRLPEDLRAAVTAVERELQRWGWRFGHQHTSSLTLCTNILAWPWMVVEGVELRLGCMTELRAMVEELHDVGARAAAAAQHRGHAMIIPSAILAFMIQRSCRGAVMLGDVLTPGHCRLLVEHLSHVHHFHLCSHGRPSLASLELLPQIQQR